MPALITPRTLTTLEEAFRQALREISGAGQAAAPALERQTLETLDGSGERRLLTLTLSSYLFRIVLLFDFRLDAPTQAYFARLFRNGDAKLAEQALADVLSEYVNMLSGTANRLLSTEALRTGMSTPFALETHCRRHLQKLAPAECLAYRVKPAEAVAFNLILCLCVAPEATLDLATAPLVEEVVGGELELF
ncbi:MAG: hypothetical protein CGU29_12435 [Candidatus Dactylopiibacterium carminicum]|uniref:Chemotaxis protein CheX n=1 Tax=Candidatus Dactylopiibacterium carminicum TaxID=857335 RepID=A0A272ERB8_9RHOO|nr:hypothetical protein [Candidatus Dactylopiibacterium carminicum]KAF7598509.1 hypothetical protein BGI27_12780 [Candidatus Dactylopiibacterium carminicum]PAS92260.1 MAG: hypothetical protein CGU29_12435 [Candidatus Dactylopiibacterium carminicum]PAS97996.1 MAG: hypothetical protein BSR46_12800 [Candidatus Dactylopiibacterium carminicum]